MARSDNKEMECWDRWRREHDKTAADYLLQLYMPLVNYHVQRISVGLPKNVERSELKSHGLYGLYDALEKFDFERDLKFDTYASFRIRGAILDGLRKEDWMPRSVREKIKKIEAAVEKIEQRKMGTATLEEVADACGMPAEEVGKIMSENLFASLVSLDDDQTVNFGERAGSMIEDKITELPEEQVIKEENYHLLASQIAELKHNERLVITLFYYEGLTLTEIGHVLGLSTSRISQIHSKALFKLRKYLKSKLE